MTVQAVVTAVKNEFVRLQIDCSQLSGVAFRENCADTPEPELAKLYAVGDKVKARVLDFDKAQRRIHFALKPSLLPQEDADVPVVSFSLSHAGDRFRRRGRSRRRRPIFGFRIRRRIAGARRRGPAGQFRLGAAGRRCLSRFRTRIDAEEACETIGAGGGGEGARAGGGGGAGVGGGVRAGAGGAASGVAGVAAVRGVAAVADGGGEGARGAAARTEDDAGAPGGGAEQSVAGAAEPGGGGWRRGVAADVICGGAAEDGREDGGSAHGGHLRGEEAVGGGV